MNAALLLTALFNGAWQGAVLCFAAYATFQLLRRLNATTMFAVWSALLAIALALPAFNYIFAARPYTVRTYAVSTPVLHARNVHAPVPSRVAVSAAAPLTVSRPPVGEIAVSAVTAVLERAWLVLLLAALVALLRLAVLVRDLIGMFAARRAAKPIELPFRVERLSRPFAFASTSELTSPCVLGFSPALIVIPDKLLSATHNELLSIVLHEREHVRRYDDVQNVLYRAIGAVAFFLPGVRLALRELALYREQICDDAAVDGIGDPVSYAMTLTGMAQWAQGRGVPVPSLIFKRKQLMHRLEVLLDTAVNHSLRTNRRFALSACAAMLLAAAIVLRFQVPVIAQVIAPPLKAPAAPHAPAAAPKTAKAPKAPAGIAVSAPKPAAPVAPKAHAIARPPKPRHPAKPLKAPHAPKIAATNELRVSAVTAARAAMLASAASTASYAYSYAYVPEPPVKIADARSSGGPSADLLDALQAAGLRNLSVDDLITIRDHGVSPQLVQSAAAYFGRGIDPKSLAMLADHGVSPRYLNALRENGIDGISPASTVLLMDHGVNADLMRAARSYFSNGISAADMVYLSDHGEQANCLYELQRYGLSGISVADVVRMMDRGVSASYAARVRKTNPRASIDDIIRLHDNGI